MIADAPDPAHAHGALGRLGVSGCRGQHELAL
jgi:hypothetical protein